VTRRGLRELSQAHSELWEAARWYENQSAGLGFKLFDAVDAAVDEILSWPEAAPIVPGRNGQSALRSKRVQRFPYRVIYFVKDEQIVIVAYAHARRKAGYWRHRVT